MSSPGPIHSSRLSRTSSFDAASSPSPSPPATVTPVSGKRASLVAPINTAITSSPRTTMNGIASPLLSSQGAIPVMPITPQQTPLSSLSSSRRLSGAVVGTPIASPPSNSPFVPPSPLLSSRLTSRSVTGEEEVVKESTLLVIWRFIIKLKRKVAGLVKSLQKKSAEIHRMLVTRFPILTRVPPVLMQQLCIKAQKRLFQRKYTLIQQGTVTDWIYFVHMGSVGVYQQSEHVLSTSGGMSVGIPNELSAGSTNSAALRAMAAASKKYESLHITDVAEGDEVGLYGLLRPPTIVLMERRKRKKKSKDAEDLSATDSEEEKDSTGKKSLSSKYSGSNSYRNGYPQPHTVIANQPSIVYALSAKLFREILLSVPDLYEEIRDEMTNKYIVRLKRFENWEIQRMRMQKIKQIQQTIVESHLHHPQHQRSRRANEQMIRASFEAAEAIVAKDTIMDLFHGQKKMFSTNALTVEGEKSLLAESSESEEEDENQKAAFSSQSASGEVLLSQWNEKQNGVLDEINGALSAIAPHHPAPNYHYVSILAQTGALGNPTLRMPPVPYVDMRKLVGSKGQYNFKAKIGPPVKHVIVPTAKLTASAAALASLKRESEMEHMLPQPSAATNLTSNDDDIQRQSSGDNQSTDAPVVRKQKSKAAGGRGAYISPEEAAYNRRIQKLQAKAQRKLELQQAHEEGKFLEDILLVSKQVKEMAKKKPAAIAVASGVGNTTHHGTSLLDGWMSKNKQDKRKAGVPAPILSPAHKDFYAKPENGPAGITINLQQQSSEFSFASATTLEPQTIFASMQQSASSSLSPSVNTRRELLSSSRRGTALNFGDVMTNTPSPDPTSSSAAVAAEEKSSPEMKKKQRNPFVTTPPPELYEKDSKFGVAASASSSSTSHPAGSGSGGGLFSSAPESPRGPFVTLPPENPAFANLPTLPSPQIRSLFQLLNDPAASGSKDPALLLLETVEARDGKKKKKYDPVPMLPLGPGDKGYEEQEAAKAAQEKMDRLRQKELDALSRSPTLKRTQSVLMDLKREVKKERPVPTLSKYDIDAPFGPTASAPPSFHSLAFHSFSEDAWRGIARVPTPPLIPPTMEDPRKVAIRQGIERAQFRVKSRSRDNQVGFKEFSKEDKKASMNLQSVTIDTDRKTDVISLIASPIGQKAAKPPLKVAPSPSATIEALPQLPQRVSHSDSDEESEAAAAKDKSGFLSTSKDTLSVVRATKRLSVLSTFSRHKAKDLVYRQRKEQEKIEAKAQAARDRKRALHRSEEVRNANAKARKQEDGGAATGWAEDSDAEKGDEDEAMDTFDFDSEESGNEKDEVAPVPLLRLGSQVRSPKFGAVSTRARLTHSAKARATKARHETFLSQHHKKVLSSLVGSPSSSTVASPSHGRTASMGLANPTVTLEEAAYQQKIAQLEHAKRLSLLTKDRLKPAPGVDAATLRKMLSSPKQQPRLQISLDPLLEEGDILMPVPAGSHALPFSPADEQKVSSTFASPMNRSKLGKSNSLPSFIDSVHSGTPLLAVTHQSSLSTMLAMAHKTREDLAQALPAMGLFADDGLSGGKGKVDPADQEVIDALTKPSHQLNASTSNVASRLAGMLAPFSNTDTAVSMNARGIRIPDYSEPASAEALLTAFQSGRAELSQKRLDKNEQASKSGGKKAEGTLQAPLLSVGGKHMILSPSHASHNSSTLNSPMSRSNTNSALPSPMARGQVSFAEKPSASTPMKKTLSSSASLPALG